MGQSFNNPYFTINTASVIFKSLNHFMKNLSLIVFLFPLWLSAQDCKLKRTTDPYTKEVKLSTGFIALQGASLSIDADSKEIDFFFSVDGRDKCFTNASTAAVFYEGTKMKANFRNNGTMNCEGFFHIIFKNGTATPALLQRLITQKISNIIFTGNDKTQTTVGLNAEQREAIMNLGNCLIKEAKSLLTP
jgi:hypothetical protein